MRVAILGGAGKMGEWFSRFFVDNGDDVVISGRNLAKAKSLSEKIPISVAESSTNAIIGADLVVISVPIQSFESLLAEIAPHLSENQKVIDITSVKVVPVDLMHKFIKSALVLGTHPLFGPSSGAEGQNFILTPTNVRERAFAEDFSSFLSSKGFKVLITNPEEHDSAMAKVLALTHFVGIVTADVWEEININEVLPFSGTSFKRLHKFVENVIESDVELYSYLQMNLPGTADLEALFAKKAVEWSTLSKKKDTESFSLKMSGLKKTIIYKEE